MTATAELFALVHTGTDGDLDFYLDVCHRARRVLELGCGHGRVLLPLARAGATVVGLDRDPQMLALAADGVERGGFSGNGEAQLVRADMSRFALAARFDRIVIPYNGLYALPDERAQLECLRCAGEHLTDDGLLIWDGYAIDDFHHTMSPDDIDDEVDDEPVDTIEWRGHGYLVFEHSTWHKDRQRIHVRYRYLPLDPRGQIYEQVVVHRYLLTTQIEELCRSAGLQPLETFSNFDGAPLNAHSLHMVCIARADAHRRHGGPALHADAG